MALVVQGRMNKVTAAELGISEITVKAHRGRVMLKMRARSLAELVIIAARLSSPPLPTRPIYTHAPINTNVQSLLIAITPTAFPS
jgi:hypothetical protein